MQPLYSSCMTPEHSSQPVAMGWKFQIELEFSEWFLMREENLAKMLTEMPREKPSKQEREPNKLNSQMTPLPGIKPGIIEVRDEHDYH